MEYLVVIPARYQSSRLPGKPLVSIAGIPMIERTYHQCVQAVPADKVVVATDDQRIFDHCTSIGAHAVMTPEDCKTGTDRIASLLDQFSVDVFINVQGDEPVLNPDDLTAVIKAAQKNSKNIINGYAEITDQEQFFSGTVPKVVCRPDGTLLYMSRSPIPSNKEGNFIKAHRQICIYSFPRHALEAFRQQKEKTSLEKIEDIEILRLLELGYVVEMIELSGDSIAVDVPDDVEKVEHMLTQKGENQKV